MPDVQDASRLENYLSGDPNAYPLDRVWEKTYEIKTKKALKFGDYKISFVAKRDPKTQILERLDLQGGLRPMVLMFPLQSMEIIGGKGSLEIVNLLPENWSMMMAQLASFSYMPPEVHLAIIGVNKLELDNNLDKTGGRLIVGSIDAKIAREPIQQISYDPKNLAPILLWNVLAARYFSQINGYPIGENPLQPVLERRTQLLEALKSGDNSQQLKALATKPF